MQTYFVLKPFTSPFGDFPPGTEASFGAGTAQVLKANHIIAELGSPAHQAFLANDEAADKQAPELAIETKPAPIAKRATKAK